MVRNKRVDHDIDKAVQGTGAPDVTSTSVRDKQIPARARTRKCVFWWSFCFSTNST